MSLMFVVLSAEINLNGSIVSATSFIHQMNGPNATKSYAPYVSAWGGIQSAGQFIGQVTLPFATERFGRKIALYIIWIVLTAVSDAVPALPTTAEVLFPSPSFFWFVCVRVHALLDFSARPSTWTQSIIAETVASTWWAWLIAKFLAGMGVGMLQGTLPMYISELSPVQLRGFLINAYTL